VTFRLKNFAILLLAAVPTSCLGRATAPASLGALPPMQSALASPASHRISHVVVIIQENRTINNFFAGYPGANAPTFGCGARGAEPGAAKPEPQTGCPRGDAKIPLHEITFVGPDFKHGWKASMIDWNQGRMDGFIHFGRAHDPYAPYARVQRSLIQPYWDIANQYVLSDAMFPTEFGGSFTSHLMLVAGNDNIEPKKAEVNFPSEPPDDCDSPGGTTSSYLTPDRIVHFQEGPFPCFAQFNSMAEVLDNAGVSWKYYATQLVDAGFWEPFEAIAYVRKGPDWKRNISTPQTKILTDPRLGKLAAVSWVMPSKIDSDHPRFRSDRGPSWVASIVNAIGKSKYWDSSAIFVVWDDWGGWYDNARPPQPDFRGLGIRVPCLIISPYAKRGYVSHRRLEFASILKFIEETFGLPHIGSPSDGYTDTRANSPTDSFDFTQKPRRFMPIQTKYSTQDFLSEPSSSGPVDRE
jgi:phospholipase C